jgi:predicted metalloenzyme YecM
MIKTIKDFYEGSEDIVSIFNSFAQKNQLEGKAQADHICYKCDSNKSFENLKSIFDFNSDFIYQSIISNRRIAFIKLKGPLETILGVIHFLELSDQKPNGSQKDGFDHIEVYPVGWSYEDMVKDLETKEEVIKIERPHHTTHDIKMSEKLIFRCTKGRLVDKIKESEMQV